MAHDKDDRMLGLSPAQVAGSALAAVSGALLASFAGTTGTIIGTAVGSVVATVGGAVYTWSLKRSSAAVLRTAAQVRQTALLTGPLPRTVVQGPMRSEDDREDGTPEAAAGSTPDGAADESAEAAVDSAAAEDRARRSIPWGKALLASLAVTGVALGGITVFEAVTGQPISSLIGRGDSQGTSVGNLVRNDRSPTEDTPTDKATPTDEESQVPEPEPEPTPTPEVPLPSVTPTAEPSTPPSAEPSVVPQDGSEGGPAADPGTGTGADPAP
jgi:hypothetical protein